MQSNNKSITIVVGFDVQVRGIASTAIDIETGTYLFSNWYPIKETETEARISEAHHYCSCYLKDLSNEYDISIISIEYPTAVVSSSSYILWMLAGAAVAAAYSNCQICEGIMPSSWKKYSGLNTWAKEHGLAKRGIILKNEIKNGIISLDKNIPGDLTPADLYDSIAIAKAARIRNEERINAQLKSTNETNKRKKG